MHSNDACLMMIIIFTDCKFGEATSNPFNESRFTFMQLIDFKKASRQ